MFGWLSDARTCASRLNRARRSGSLTKASGRILRATARFSFVSRARQTSPYSCAVKRSQSLSRERRASKGVESRIFTRAAPERRRRGGAHRDPGTAASVVLPRRRGRIGVPRKPGRSWADVAVGCVRAHRLRYDSTSPTAATVWHGRSSGDDARWSDIAYSDVVRVVMATQDSTIGLAPDQRQARWRTEEKEA